MRRATTLLSPLLLLALCCGAAPASAAGGSDGLPVAAADPVVASSDVASPASSLGVEATGDRRHVTEPAPPAATCATVPAQLAMPDRAASAAEEQRPPDTARLQQALDACAGSSGAVRLVAGPGGAAFLSGPLSVRQGEVLLLDPAVTLYASRDAHAYQVPGRSTCGTISGDGDGCLPFLSVASHAGVESTRTAQGRQGRIDGRGDMTILGSGVTWWQLGSAAKSGGSQNAPRLLRAQRAVDVTVHDIDLVDAAGVHIAFDHGQGLTVWGVLIFTPAFARNTDGVDPAGSQDVTVTRSYIMDGDDGIAIKAANEASAHITVSHNAFHGTHGISIGSETLAGVSDVLVVDNTVSGRDAYGQVSVAAGGIRIKSSSAAGGPVRDVTFRDTCVDGVKGPIVLDTRYASGTGAHVPSFTGIVVDGFRATNSVRGAASVFEGYDAAHPLDVVLRRTEVDDPDVRASFADITDAGSRFGGAPLAATGPGVHVTTQPSAGSPTACSAPETLPR